MTVIAEVTRSGIVESRHDGSLIGLHRDGSVAFAIGDVDGTMYPRSSTKPLLTVGMLELGLELTPPEVALATSSHSGEPEHLEVVVGLLERFGLHVADLGNTPDLPLGVASRRDAMRNGRTAASLTMNCSGKHAAMLATCAINGWSRHDYLDVGHPLQVALTKTVDRLTHGHRHIGVDGCGAPAHAMSLVDLARAFRSIALGTTPAAATVRDGVLAHPHLLGGTDRDVTAVVASLGIFAKDGAEGVYAASTPEGHAVALKINDGSERARPAVLIAALNKLGIELGSLPEQLVVPVLGHGKPVGIVRATIE